MTDLDTNRHLSVFDPYAFGNRRVDIIGCGATGSRAALSIAKLGVKNIHCWDFDVVEGHNIANQAFGLDDVGKQKVVALQEMILRQTGTKIEAHDCAYEGQEALGQIVFLLTDTMKSRKDIWESRIRYQPGVKLMIETRMGADQARIYAIDPVDREQVLYWEENWYGDDKAEVSACGTRISVGPTAEALSSFAVWSLIQWFDSVRQEKSELMPERQVLLYLRPFTVMVLSAMAK
jgi:hypothetical protein